jgi:nucleoside-diphosphate-sugar epimerase
MILICFLHTETKWNAARLLFIYGPEQYAEGGYKSVIVTNFERILNGKRPLIKGDGKHVLDYVYVEDCKNALRMLAESESTGNVVNVASNQPVEILNLVREMCFVAGVDFDPEFVKADWTAGTFRVGSNSLIARQFGWSPTVDLHEGLTRTWKQMKKEFA